MMPYFCVWSTEDDAREMFWLMASNELEACRLVALNAPPRYADPATLKCALNASKAPPPDFILDRRGNATPIVKRR
ncbi:MAG: hypothetical protein IT562_23100 [Alphaproteobacteria bacterium]|nr:hypothetical protein [Alphaproteobacteria bacterium]